MFEITNETLKEYAGLRNKDAYVMPMYVSLYNEKFALNELDQITDYSPNSLKVGFVSVTSPIEKRPFTLNSIFEVDIKSSFTDYDEKKSIDVNYILFETGLLEGNGPMYEQINYYINQLDDYVRKIVAENKAKQRKENKDFNDYYS